MSKEIKELQRIRSILSYVTGLEEDDQENIEDARKSIGRVIDSLADSLAEQPAQQEPVQTDDALKRARSAFEMMVRWSDSEMRDGDSARELAEKMLLQLAAPAQQTPVAEYIGECSDGSLVQLYDDLKKGTKLYTSPPVQRSPLTDDELADLWYKQSLDWMEFARAIEQAHGIKENT